MDSKKNLIDYDVADLKKMNQETLTEILLKEAEYYRKYADYKNKLSIYCNKDVINVLKSYFLAESNIKEFSTHPDAPFYSIYTPEVYAKHSDRFSKEEFLDLIKILYLNGYIIYTSGGIEDLEVDDSSLDDSFRFLHSPFVVVYNLTWIYKNYPHLFSADILKFDEYDVGKHNITNGPEYFYNLFKEYGSIVESIGSFKSMTCLANRGMQRIHEDNFQQSIKIKEFQKDLEEKQEALNNKQRAIGEANKSLSHKQKDFQNTLNLYESKIKNSQKDLVTVLSIMVAAFSVIGINVTSLGNLSENLILGLVTINASVIFTISFLGFILKELVFDFRQSPNSNKWRNILIGNGIIVLICLLVVFLNDAQLGKTQKYSDMEKEINELKKENSQLKQEQKEISTKFIDLSDEHAEDTSEMNIELNRLYEIFSNNN